MFIKLKELPQSIQLVLLNVGYKKPDIKVEIINEIDLHCSGGAGQRGFAVILNLDTGETKRFTGSWGGANMFNPNNTVDLDTSSHIIPVNGAVIKGSEGSYVYATVYVSQANIVKALDSPKNDLTPNEKGILKVFSSLKSSYRKEYIYGSYSNEYFEKPLTENEYSMVLTRLSSLGLIKVNKAGSASLTTEGKNALN